MTKGVFRGVFWAAVLGGTGLATASILAPLPAGNLPPSTPQVTAPQSTDLIAPSKATPPKLVGTSDPVELATAPRVVSPAQEGTTPEADTDPLALPSTTDVGIDLAAPETGVSPDLAAETETPVLPNPQSIAPQVPINEEDLQVELATPQPVEVVDPEVVVETVPTEDRAVEIANAETENEEITATLEAEVIIEAPIAVEAPTADTTALNMVPQFPQDGQPTPDAPASLESPDAPELTPDLDISGGPKPRVVSLADGESAARPSGVGKVKVNRGLAAPSEQDVAQMPDLAPAEAEDTRAPLEAYATPYEGQFDRPLMSLILLDTGALDGAPRAVNEVPFPVTVVIDATRPDSAERMSAYRAAGVEVAATMQLPSGALAADIEVALEATFKTLPQTVALIDMGGESRAATEQILATLSRDGRGFVSADNGLNSGVRAARSADVPAAEVYRDIDGAGQDARAIRRFLDQAAFRARQDDSVVVMGRIEAETLSALIQWGSASRAGQVDLVPLSAVLQYDLANAR